MRPALAAAASGSTIPATLLLAAAVAVHAARSLDRLLDLAYVAAFYGIGVLVG